MRSYQCFVQCQRGENQVVKKTNLKKLWRVHTLCNWEDHGFSRSWDPVWVEDVLHNCRIYWESKVSSKYHLLPALNTAVKNFVMWAGLIPISPYNVTCHCYLSRAGGKRGSGLQIGIAKTGSTNSFLTCIKGMWLLPAALATVPWKVLWMNCLYLCIALGDSK